MQTLILGGARSGKSRFAEQWAMNSKEPVTYIATATAEDDEMGKRIAHHRTNRPRYWQTLEEPVYLAQALESMARDGQTILVDCLTLWLTNLLCKEDAELLEQETEQLLNVVPDLPGTLILVSNEVGLGIVPMGELTRRYVDEAGRLHQALAQQCDPVVMMVAGLPHYLKGTAPWNG